jgi:hypothetical protein
MTALDLRIKFRFETGVSPTYSVDSWGHNYKGELSSRYVQWLEGYGIIASIKRVAFKQETGNDAVYYNRRHWNWKYTKEYKEWIEEEFIKSLNHN